jgi:hypothetical protein
MIKYKVARSRSPELFENEVNELLNDGFMPLGNLVYADGYFVQALIQNYGEMVVAMSDKIAEHVESKVNGDANIIEQ